MTSDKFNRRVKLCQLIISVAMPLAIGFSGYFIQLRIGETQPHQTVLKDVSSKLADRRLLICDQIKHPLNDIYYYIEEVGDWEGLSAPKIRQIRSNLNNIMCSNRAIWSLEVFCLYINYMDDVAFEVNHGNNCARIGAELNPERRIHESGDDVDKLLAGEKNLNTRMFIVVLMSHLQKIFHSGF
ncbi:hypothetical protein [Serratia rhizosphaerae]|uniref:Uncharacterized protein n=1 Tax=Serratia rhizosphaerae TaxID=2597702 RepID=A0ABX6GP46_9GAMM|nr:hypothetical protein [Serratia rhizosphaerae]QHA88002.1 hypothetical protein FO014_14100 [Serratia rhizosphaerae]